MNQRLNDSGSSPTVVDDLVFLQGERNLVCVDLKSGETQWSEPIDATDSRYTSPASADGKVFFATEGLICFQAAREGMNPLFDAGLVLDNRLVAKEEVRKRLKIDSLEETTDGRPKAQQLWHAEVITPGPLRCVTPALADGKLYLRTNGRIVCFDLKRD
jgi:outer membrane protein assembly factor BamB